MITMLIWGDRETYFGNEYLPEILKCTFLSIIAIPFDIILLPVEIVSFIIYKILNK